MELLNREVFYLSDHDLFSSWRRATEATAKKKNCVAPLEKMAVTPDRGVRLKELE